MGNVTVDYFGVPGTGRTVTEAKQDAGRKIQEAMDGYYHPTLIQASPGLFAIMWRHPIEGWSYRVVEERGASLTPVEVGRSEELFGTCGARDRDGCERRARRHLAQWVYEPGGDDGAGLIRNDADRRDHLAWCAWQNRYAAWKGYGATDESARAGADRGTLPIIDVA